MKKMKIPNRSEATYRPIEAMQFGNLQELLSKDSNDLLLSLLCPRSGFKERLAYHRASDPMVLLLLKVIVKVCQSQETEGSLLQLLGLVIDSCFMKQVLCEYLSKYLDILPAKVPNQDSIQQILLVLQELIKRLPTKSLPIVTILQVQINNAVTCLTSLKCEIFSGVLNTIERLEKSVSDIHMNKILGNLTKDQIEDVVIQNHGEAFRRMSVIPTSNDLCGFSDVLINKNNIFGKYKDVTEYLDVQFRLLREDLIRPLREGFQQLLESKQRVGTNHHKTYLKVYKNVHIISPTFCRSGISHLVKFDCTHLKRISWESSKRLCFGTLVCLFNDELNNDERLSNLLFATVVERDIDKLRNGEIGLHFEEEDGFQNVKFQPGYAYTMIESPTYFEAYRHILRSLQLITDDSMPFSEYILNNRVKDEPILSPKYLRNSQSSYDFRSIMTDHSGVTHCDPLDFNAWPTGKQLNLDESQYNALRSGLTKELAIIQGPPGTGKTFLGLKIVKVLLANESIWNPTEKKAPILIVCYTNHALDQFLEGILKDKLIDAHSGIGSLVRIGGRSKSEMLKSCHLAEIKQGESQRHRWGEHGAYLRKNRLRHGGYTFHRYASVKYAARIELKIIEYKIFKLAAYIDLSRVEIINEFRLTRCLTSEHATSLLQYSPRTKSILLHWLMNGMPFKSERVNVLHILDSILNVNTMELFTECHRQIFEDYENKSESYDYETVKSLTRNCGDFILEAQDRNVIEVMKLRMDDETFQGIMTLSDAADCLNVWNLNQTDRWRLYHFWVSQLVEPLIQELNTMLREYDAQRKVLDEIVQEEDYDIISKSQILGMTTSGSAKHRQLLQRVKPRIVIIEEAAEVFEAHIVTSLSSSCEHLILIGDHQQLRPASADYELGKKFHLEISLFERLVLNHLPCDRLDVQHRMRPEISELIVPHIYKDLKNSESVLSYKHVYGILGNVFFIDHAIEEEYAVEGQSYSNTHEATFMSALCLYLLNVGYYSKKITVLTTYTGQIRLLRKHMPKPAYDNVCITTVDNYQGEENDIILLSLVRSNKMSKIGFSGISNRVCVALSRAKKGLFIIGNASLLNDVSVLWHNILSSMRKQNRVVEKLPLGCDEHTNNVYYVASAQDFLKVPSRGCALPCDYRLDCGHSCGLCCHPFDQEHKEYVCKKLCTKFCPFGHPCVRACWQECGKCLVLVEKTLSRCQHTAKMPCYVDENDFQGEILVERTFCCTKPCKKLCSFGHPCLKACWKECGKCLVLVEKTLSRCQHTAKIPCYVDENYFQCEILVERTLSRCQHTATMHCYLDEHDYQCRELCKESCAGVKLSHPYTRVCCEPPADCNVPVERILPTCGHKKLVPCHIFETMQRDTILCTAERNISSLKCIKQGYKACDQFSSVVDEPHVHYLHTVDNETVEFKESWKKFNECLMPCNRLCKNQAHLCMKRCWENCGRCHVQVDKIFPQCKHVQRMSCYKSPERAICKAPCEKSLLCGHKCKNRCGEECTDLCTVAISHELLPCLHTTVYQCWETESEHSKCESVSSDPESKYTKCDSDIEDSQSESTDRESEYSSNDQFMPEITSRMHLNNEVLHYKKWTFEATGHKYTPSCSRLCKNVCNEKLSCGHECSGICSTCTSSGEHRICTSSCSKDLLFCSHSCAGKCGNQCLVCSFDCQNSCRHSRCRYKCSAPCKPCDIPCDWRCSHKDCNLTCSEPCTRAACNEPCELLLECKHPCMGLCGEKCLDICIECHPEHFEEIERQFPECEISKSTRYVKLLPCQHVIPVKYIDYYVKNYTKISTESFKSYLSIYCPLDSCRKEVKICPRFNSQIKRLKSSQMNAKFKIAQEVISINEAMLHWKVVSGNQFGGLNKSQLRRFTTADHCRNLKIRTIYLWNECKCLFRTVKMNEESVSVSRIFNEIEVDLIECMQNKDASCIACKFVELGRVYINLYALHLYATTIGPKLKTLDECRKTLTLTSNLKIGTNACKAWKLIQTLSNRLKVQFQLPGKQMKPLVDFTSFLDAPLTSEDHLSNWISCTKGHAYVCVDITPYTDAEMDKNCSTCHSLSQFLWNALCPEKLTFIAHKDRQEQKEEGSSVSVDSRLAWSDQGRATFTKGSGSVSMNSDLPSTSKLIYSRKQSPSSAYHCDSLNRSRSRERHSFNVRQSHPSNNSKSSGRDSSNHYRQSHSGNSSNDCQSYRGPSLKNSHLSRSSFSRSESDLGDECFYYNWQSHVSDLFNQNESLGEISSNHNNSRTNSKHNSKDSNKRKSPKRTIINLKIDLKKSEFHQSRNSYVTHLQRDTVHDSNYSLAQSKVHLRSQNRTEPFRSTRQDKLIYQERNPRSIAKIPPLSLGTHDVHSNSGWDISERLRAITNESTHVTFSRKRHREDSLERSRDSKKRQRDAPEYGEHSQWHHGDSQGHHRDSQGHYRDSQGHNRDSQGHNRDSEVHHGYSQHFKRRRLLSHERDVSELGTSHRMSHSYKDLDAVCSEEQYFDEHILTRRRSHFQRYNQDEDNYFS